MEEIVAYEDTSRSSDGYTRPEREREREREKARELARERGVHTRGQKSGAYVSIRQHTSAYGRIHQHTSAYVSIRIPEPSGEALSQTMDIAHRNFRRLSRGIARARERLVVPRA